MTRTLVLALAALAVLGAQPVAAEDYAWLGFAPEKARGKLLAQARRFDAAALAASKEGEADAKRYLDLAAAEAFRNGPAEADSASLLAAAEAVERMSVKGAAQKARAVEAEAFRRLLAPYLAGLKPPSWEALVAALESRQPPFWNRRYPSLPATALTLAKARADSGARALYLRLVLAGDAEAAAAVLAVPDKETARVLGLLKLAPSAAPLAAELKAARAWLAALRLARAPGLVAGQDSGPLGLALDAMDPLRPARALEIASSFPGDVAPLLQTFLSALDPDGQARLARAWSLSPARTRILLRIFALADLEASEPLPAASDTPPLPGFEPERLAAAGKAISAYRSAEALGADPLPSLRLLFSDPLARSLLASAPDLAGLSTLALGRIEALAQARLADSGAPGVKASLASLHGETRTPPHVAARWSDRLRGLWTVELGFDGGTRSLRAADAASSDLATLLFEDLIGQSERADEVLAGFGAPDGRPPAADWNPGAFAAAWLSGAGAAAALEARLGLPAPADQAARDAACDAYLRRGQGSALAEFRAADPGAASSLGARLRVARAALANLQASGELP